MPAAPILETPALETLALEVRRRGRVIIDGISISISAGEVVGIIGPNGAGKSTWIKSALGLVPAAAGTARLMGSDMAALPVTSRARRAAYVPQDREIAWALTVRAVVALGRLPYRPPFAAASAADKDAIERAMVDADIVELADRPVNELSGGERARVLIARALAQDAPLLLADEPTSGLDPAHQIALLKLFRKRADAGGAIGLSIHELHLAARWCDRLILLDHGRIAAQGPPRDVLTPANIRAVYACDAIVTDVDGDLVVIPTARPPT